MLKPTVVLFAAFAAITTPRAEGVAGALSFSGTLDSATDVDAYSFCATAGDAIGLRVDGTSSGLLTPFRAAARLLDASGKPIPSITGAWRAPYTGVYYGSVAGDAATRGDYLLTVGINGETGVLDPADLSVTESGMPESVAAGDPITLTITVGNAGPTIALDATMLDPLPFGTSFVSLVMSPPDAAWECTTPAPGANGKFSCTNKCFEPRDSVTFTIVVKVEGCTTDGTITNSITVSSLNPDPNNSDNASFESAALADPGACEDGNICTTGDRCEPGVDFAEDFDLTPPRSLPPGWTATNLIGPPGAVWRVVSTAFDTAPNSIFALDAAEVRDSVLDSPGILIRTPTPQLHFMNRYDLEFKNDGGVLQIKIGNGSFVDILDAGGSFLAGGYDDTIRNEFQSPIAGKRAWTGNSGGFRETIVDLPGAATFGRIIVLRWRLASDLTVGRIGQWIDSIYLTGPDECRAGSLMSCSDNDPCTDDTCDSATGCRHDVRSCDDGDVCTDDACDEVLQCIHTNNTAACDDFNACTQTDTCQAGACVGSNPLLCSDTDACTSEACDPLLGCVAPTADFDATGFSAGRVDGRDLAIFARAWNSCPGGALYNPAANLDPSGNCVDLADFHLFMNAFGHSCGP
jgi:uncharacterized repeat protein (TIGR01451 family)